VLEDLQAVLLLKPCYYEYSCTSLEKAKLYSSASSRA
jgi:hypothetical protein